MTGVPKTRNCTTAPQAPAKPSTKRARIPSLQAKLLLADRLRRRAAYRLDRLPGGIIRGRVLHKCELAHIGEKKEMWSSQAALVTFVVKSR